MVDGQCSMMAVGTPARAESKVFGYFDFFGQVGQLLWSGRHFGVWKPRFELYIPSFNHLMKKEWLMVNVIGVTPHPPSEQKVNLFGLFLTCLPS